MSSGEPVMLLGSFGSSFTHRAEAALRLKGVPYEFVEEDLGNKSALLLASNPVHKKVPLLLPPSRSSSSNTWTRPSRARRCSPPSRSPALTPSSGRSSPPTGSRGRCSRRCGRRRARRGAGSRKRRGRTWRSWRRGCRGDAVGYLDVAASALATWLHVLEELAGAGAEGTLMGEEEFPALCRWRREYTADEAVRACLPRREQLVAYYAAKKDGFVVRGKSLQKQ